MRAEENCVVRGSMYVELMGRDVIFICIRATTEGNNTDMNANLMVTAASGTDNSKNNNNNASGAASTDNTSSAIRITARASGRLPCRAVQAPDIRQCFTERYRNDKTATVIQIMPKRPKETGSAPKPQSSITQVAAPASSSGTDSSTLNSAEGLSLSTAQDASDKENVSDTDAAKTSGSSAFQIGLAVTVAGLILIAVAAGIVYFFRRNWRRWGGGEDDEEE